MYELGSSPEALALDTETAARISQHFQIEVYGVEHGYTVDQLAALMPGSESFAKATVTDESRAITRTLVDTLGPDDILFREAYGYPKQTAEPSQTDKDAPSAEQRRIAKEMLAAEQHKFDAISYGATHAIINGTHVMHADSNAEQEAAHKATSMGFGAVDAARHIDALVTVIGYAASRLPEEGTPVPKPEERRRLMLLFGGGHVTEIKQLVDAAKLPITVHTTEETKKIAAAQMVAVYVAGFASKLTGFFNEAAK